jgi:hypothetical protein
MIAMRLHCFTREESVEYPLVHNVIEEIYKKFVGGTVDLGFH